MSVVDSYDAMVTDRPYRKALSKEETLLCLSREVNEGKLDSRTVVCLQDMVTHSRDADEGKQNGRSVKRFHDLNGQAPPGSALAHHIA